MRGNFDEGIRDYDALWRALCERVYPMRDTFGVGDGRRMFHQDLPLLTELDLELDKLRARFRVCLEEDFSDRRWLLERIDKIVDEQARRAELAWPPTDPEEIAVRPRRDLEASSPGPPRENKTELEAEPPRPRLGHVGHRVGPIEMAELVRAMLAKLDRQAHELDEGRNHEGREAR